MERRCSPFDVADLKMNKSCVQPPVLLQSPLQYIPAMTFHFRTFRALHSWMQTISHAIHIQSMPKYRKISQTPSTLLIAPHTPWILWSTLLISSILSIPACILIPWKKYVTRSVKCRPHASIQYKISEMHLFISLYVETPIHLQTSVS